VRSRDQRVRGDHHVGGAGDRRFALGHELLVLAVDLGQAHEVVVRPYTRARTPCIFHTSWNGHPLTRSKDACQSRRTASSSWRVITKALTESVERRAGYGPTSGVTRQKCEPMRRGVSSGGRRPRSRASRTTDN
jgi:hypothetical protein